MRLIRSLLLATLLVVGVAGPAMACGYWSCTEHEGGWECYWFEG